MSKICLNMIVKDEAPVIERCLESIASFIDYWVISDTGSSDQTKQLVTDFFAARGIPGALVEHQWVDFSHNRNLALAAAKDSGCDYLLFMDADDYFEAESGFRFRNLKADAYLLNVKRASVNYAFPKLVKVSLPWKWVGVLHETLECEQAKPAELYPGKYCIYSTSDGSRGNDPDKYKKDIELLSQGLKQEPGNARYQFYLAQSYRDAGDQQNALKHYEKRVAMAGWEEEVFCSMLEAARCKQRLQYPSASVIDSYLRAHHYRPQRLEALCDAMRYCRENELYHVAYQLGAAIEKAPLPKDILFVEQSVYQWRFFDELSVSAIYSGYKTHAQSLIKRLLASTALPDTERERLERNLEFTA